MSTGFDLRWKRRLACTISFSFGGKATGVRFSGRLASLRRTLRFSNSVEWSSLRCASLQGGFRRRGIFVAFKSNPRTVHCCMMFIMKYHSNLRVLLAFHPLFEVDCSHQIALRSVVQTPRRRDSREIAEECRALPPAHCRPSRRIKVMKIHNPMIIQQ